MMSCEMAPAMLMKRPDEVERNAANAPAATRAPRAVPTTPADASFGSTRTTESVWPDT